MTKWNVSPTDWEDCHAGIYEEQANSYVAVVIGGPDSEEHTNLIAAAPELLTSLEAIISLAQEALAARIASDDPEDNDGDLIALYQLQISDAYAAITNAKG